MISWIGDFLVMEQGGSRILYAATRSGGGILALGIDSGMSVISQTNLGSLGLLSAFPTLDLLTVGTATRLIVSGTNQSTLLSYRMDATGRLISAIKPEGGPAGVITAQAVVGIEGQTWIFAAMSNGTGLRSYAMAANGVLSLQHELSLGADLQGVNISALLHLTVGAARFLAAALPGQDRIVLMQIGADGALVPCASLGAAQGLGIDAPSALETVVAHGVTYLLAAAGGSSSLSVIEIAADGAMTLRDHVIDTLDTRFQGLRAFDSFALGGRAFIVAGGGDAGVDLFEILPGGRLVHLAQLLDTDATAMDGISAITVSLVGLVADVFVAGETAGITRLRLDLSVLGPVLTGGAADDSLTGGTGDDLILGGAGNDLLTGGAGQDVLADGTGTDTLAGGAGADLFVLSADGQTDVIADFQPGIDRIDLTAWGRVFSAPDLVITPMAWGARISFGNEVLDVRSANGLPLSPAVFTTAGLFPLWHDLPALTGPDGRIRGTEASEAIFGTAADDVFLGSAGNDTIDGGDGFDIMDYSGAAGPVIASLTPPSGPSANDPGDRLLQIEGLRGSAFADWLTGSALADALWGEGGHDQIWGREGNDTLDGVAGNDTLWGGAGNDVLVGGEGDDFLTGGAGADQLVGGAGNDAASYGDSATGVRADLAAPGTNTGDAAGDSYSGIETLAGSNLNDTLLGDAGRNLLVGFGGHDQIWGREGNDTLDGVAGNDTLDGGAGNDVLVGGAGEDRFVFGAGQDTILGFENDIDTIALSTALWAGPPPSIAEILATATTTAGGILLTFGGQTLEVRGITDPNLLSDDIIFV